jgi:hypothetical protein
LTERSHFRVNFNGIKRREEDERGVDGMRTGRHARADGAELRRQREMTKRSQSVVGRTAIGDCRPAGREEQSQSVCRRLKQGRVAVGIGSGGTKPIGVLARGAA